MSRNRRALDASREILAFGQHRNRARPLAYVEAIKIAEPHQRERMIHNAAEALAGAPNPGAAAQEIAAAYFGDLPRPDLVRDHPSQVSGLGTEMPPDAKPSDTAPAPVPGKCYGAEDGAVGEPLPDDGRRTLDELETAGEVLVRAALLRVDLAEPLRKVLLTVRRLAYRMLDGDRSGSQRIDSLASKIHDASKAAGTGAADPMNLRRRSDVERRFVDQALARGACSDEIAAVERFSSDYDTLRRHGCEPRQSRERFIELNLRQWRLTRN